MSELIPQMIDLYAGEACTLSLAVAKNGVAVDLTGRSLIFAAKRALSVATADISASSEGASPAIIVTDAAGGLAEIRLTATHTAWAAAYGSRERAKMIWDLWDSAMVAPIAVGTLVLRRLPQSGAVTP